MRPCREAGDNGTVRVLPTERSMNGSGFLLSKPFCRLSLYLLSCEINPQSLVVSSEV